MGLSDDILRLRDNIGSDQGHEELRKIVEKEDPQRIVKLCCSVTSLSSVDGPLLLRMCLLGSLSDRHRGLRLKIIQNTLEVLMNESCLPNAVASDVVSVLQLHFDVYGLDSPDLVKLISICVEKLDSTGSKDSSQSLHARWLEILSKLLSLVQEKEYVITSADDDEEIPGRDYRQRIVRSLCSVRLCSSLVVSLVTMFRDASLNTDEMDLVLEKICNTLKKMAPNEVPPLIYQTLLLCRSSNECLRIVVVLAEFYNKKFATIKNAPESEDMIDSNDESSGLCESEGTVIYHISHAIKMGHPVGKEIVKLLKSGSQIPEIIFGHFTLYLALSLGSHKQFQASMMECLKTSTVKSLALKHKRDETAWLRTISASPPNACDAFKDIIEQTTRHGGWDLVGQGVVDIAMTYLDTSPPMIGSPDEKLYELWDLGTKILHDVIQFQPDTLPILLKELTKRLIFSRAAARYSAALHSIVRESVSLLMERPSMLYEIIEQIGSLGVPGARRIMSALMPMIKSTRSLRDVTILVLRKALFNPQVESRKIGVIGVLQLLKHFRLNSSFPVSQMLSQSQSSLSQVAVDVHRGVSMTSEALCLEILGVLRRCFSQPAGVKLTLYQGLYDVVIRNGALCGAVLDMLHHHVVVSNINNPNSINPIDIDEMIGEESGEPYVKEPIGWFLHCCQLVVGKAQEMYDGDSEKEEEAPSLDKMLDMCDDLAQKYSAADLTELGLEKNADFSRASLSGQINILKVEAFKNVYEALMEHIIMHGIDVRIDKANLVVQLFNKHVEIASLLKSSGTAAKGNKRVDKSKEKKMDDTTQDNTGKDAKGDQKGGKGRGSRPASKTVFTFPEHAFSLRALSVVLRVILVDKTPSHQPAASVLRECDGFQVYILRVVSEKISQVEKSLTISGDDLKTETVFNQLVSIGKCLSEFVLSDVEGDARLLANVTECLTKNLHLVKIHFKDRFLEFTETMSREKGELAILRLLELVMLKTISVVESNDQEEDGRIKSVGHFLNLMNFLMKQLVNDGSSKRVSTFSSKLLDWTQSFMSKVSSRELLTPSVELSLLAETRYRAQPSLYVDLAAKIHDIIGDDENSTINRSSVEGFEFLTESNGDQLFLCLASAIDNWLDVTDLVIGRLKPLFLCNDLTESNLTEWEVGVCHNLVGIINAVAPLSITNFKQSQSFDQIFKLFGRVYTSMGNLTKYFFLRTKSSKEAVRVAKFDSLVSRLSKSLTVHVNQLIVAEKENNGSSKKKGSDARSTLKEAKMIPMLIYKLEAFEKDIIRLDNRVKIGLASNLRPSSLRDFRLKLEKEVPREEEQDEKSDESDDGEGEEDSREHAAESTRIESSQTSQDSNVGADSQESVIQAGLLEPPNKKMKVKMSFNKSKK